MNNDPVVTYIFGESKFVTGLQADETSLSQVCQIVDNFILIYWRLLNWRDNTKYMGISTVKFPTDMWIYQEIIHETKPDILIETGTLFGGSALFFAHLFDAIGNGKVITIDMVKRECPEHPRIEYLIGRSDDKEIIKKVKSKLNSAKVMVVLDSSHHDKNVLKELQIYSPMVTSGQYLIVEDAICGGNPVWAYDTDSTIIKPGPIRAIRRYLINNPDFEIDQQREKFLLTTNRMGYWRRK